MCREGAEVCIESWAERSSKTPPIAQHPRAPTSWSRPKRACNCLVRLESPTCFVRFRWRPLMPPSIRCLEAVPEVSAGRPPLRHSGNTAPGAFLACSIQERGRLPLCPNSAANVARSHFLLDLAVRRNPKVKAGSSTYNCRVVGRMGLSSGTLGRRV